ncbi:hypothetical protein L1887_27446 [Cichorium endivia]|nr:hypothetical protein L1887_27446 [Cichorium endivia]
MKLSFSVSSSKNSSKPSKSPFCSSQDEDDRSPIKEFVTEFDPSKTLADSNSKRTIVIPPIPNEWNPQKQMMNIDLPVKSNDPNLEFEVDPNSTVESINSNITYGLNLRAKKDCWSDPKGDRSESLSSIDRLMLMKLRNDLRSLPDDRGLAEFDDISVDEFAPALLKGYGWYEGRGIGKNAKEDVKVVQFTKRTANEGLGFVRTDDGDHRTKKGVTNGGKKREVESKGT